MWTCLCVPAVAAPGPAWRPLLDVLSTLQVAAAWGLAVTCDYGSPGVTRPFPSPCPFPSGLLQGGSGWLCPCGHSWGSQQKAWGDTEVVWKWPFLSVWIGPPHPGPGPAPSGRVTEHRAAGTGNQPRELGSGCVGSRGTPGLEGRGSILGGEALESPQPQPGRGRWGSGAAGSWVTRAQHLWMPTGLTSC